MGKRTLRAEDVEGFMLAAWDELEDIERDYGYTVLLDIRRSHHRGKWTFHAHAVREEDTGADLSVALAEAQWPSFKYMSLHAMLLSLGSKLSIACMHEYRERTGDYLHGEIRPAPPPMD